MRFLASWSQWAKYAHNYLSFPFTLGVVLMFLMWIAWNFPSSVDVRYLAKAAASSAAIIRRRDASMRARN